MKALDKGKDILVQFVGFTSRLSVREYSFTVRESAEEPRDFKITIAQESFNTRRLRFQDAPDVCSIKLRHELAAHENHPTESRFHITNDELDDYRKSHTPVRRSMYSRPPVEKF